MFSKKETEKQRHNQTDQNNNYQNTREKKEKNPY